MHTQLRGCNRRQHKQDTLPTRPNDEERTLRHAAHPQLYPPDGCRSHARGVLPGHNEPHRRGIRRARHIRTHGCASRGASHRFCNSIQRTSEGGMDGGRLPGHRRRRVLRKPEALRAGDSHAARRHDKGRHDTSRRPPRHRAADNKRQCSKARTACMP